MEKKENTEVLDDTFIAAARDYRMLLDKDYPLDASLKLVGDRYRLSHNGRMMLYSCLLYTSDAADDLLCVVLGCCRIIKKNKISTDNTQMITTPQNNIYTVYPMTSMQLLSHFPVTYSPLHTYFFT